MGRTLRPHLPGIPFHLTARIQGREPLLAGAEDAVLLALIRCSVPAGIQLLAFAIMPNHLHVVAVQGQQPLSWFMHPLLRRIALVVRRLHGGAGHVFERRYFSAPCLDPDYLRTAIAYVHLNPVRAGMCREPGDSTCTSHLYYAMPEVPDFDRFPATRDGLSLFAPHSKAGDPDCRRNYVRFVEWRLNADRRAAEGLPGTMVRPPAFVGGDFAWRTLYGMAAGVVQPGIVAQSPKREELSDIARRVTCALAPGLPLDMVRVGGRSRTVVEVRNAIIARALQVGHAASAIARFLRVSSSTVSRVAVRQRLSLVQSATGRTPDSSA